MGQLHPFRSGENRGKTGLGKSVELRKGVGMGHQAPRHLRHLQKYKKKPQY